MTHRETEAVFGWLEKLAEKLKEMRKAKAAAIRERRKAGQNKPHARERKSEAMKRHWQRKREAAEREVERQKRERLRTELELWRDEGCQCAATPRPPCYFCENATEEDWERWESSR